MIERLKPPASEADIRALAELLLDAIDAGAAVSFLATLTRVQAEDWWRRMVTAPGTGAIVLVARDANGIVGTVQLHPARAPNQPHRADVAKVLVHRRARRRGIASQLMAALEAEAQAAGFRLLTLDAKRGEAAEAFYRKLGWTHAGTIPRYALDPDGKTLHDAALFYKELPGDSP